MARPSIIRYTPNRAGIAKLMVGPEVYAAVLAEAELAKTIAEALAYTYAKTGNYQRSFRVEAAPPVRIAGHARARALLMNVARYAAADEFGHQGNHQGHRTLGKTLDLLNVGGRRRR